MGLMSREQQRLLASVPPQLTRDLLGTPEVVEHLRRSQAGGCGSFREGFAGTYSCETRGVAFKAWGGQEAVLPYRAARQHRDALQAGVIARLDATTVERTRIAVARFDLLPSRSPRWHGADPDPDPDPDDAHAAQRATLLQRDIENTRAMHALLPDLLPLAYVAAEPHDLFDLAGITL